MRFILIAIVFTAAAAAADQQTAALPRMTPEAYARMLERGEQLRADLLVRAKKDTPSERKAKLAELEGVKGRLVPYLAMASGTGSIAKETSGRFAGCYIVDQIIGESTTVLRNANPPMEQICVDGVRNARLVDGDSFSAGETILETDGHVTLPDGSTVLHLRAVLPPAP